MKRNENPSISLLVINNTPRFFFNPKKIICKIVPCFVVNLGLFIMKHFKILTVPVTQIISEVKYSILFPYRGTLFCDFSASASFKNIEFLLSYLLATAYGLDGPGIESRW